MIVRMVGINIKTYVHVPCSLERHAKHKCVKVTDFFRNSNNLRLLLVILTQVRYLKMHQKQFERV